MNELSSFRNQHESINTLRTICQDSHDRQTTHRNLLQQKINAHTPRVHATITNRTGGTPATSADPVTATATTPSNTSAVALASPAKHTIMKYTNPNSPTTHPKDPCTGYCSQHPLDFRGCMVCGSNSHVFRDCHLARKADAIACFFRELLAHYPVKRLRPPSLHEIAEVKRLCPETAIAEPIFEAPLDGPPAKAPRVYTVFASVAGCYSATATRPMPITIENELPTIALLFGLLAVLQVSVLVDTCASLNTGYLPFHLDILKHHPECVTDFAAFDGSDGDGPFC
jgi:hypothetical protein